jgi:hypothetical protein
MTDSKVGPGTALVKPDQRIMMCKQWWNFCFVYGDQVTVLKIFFPSSLTTRPNKLEGLSLETLSSQVLEFEGKARANPVGASFRCFLLG